MAAYLQDLILDIHTAISEAQRKNRRMFFYWFQKQVFIGIFDLLI